MPRARLPTKGGMFTNIRAAGLPADGRGPVVMNIVCDAAGNSRGRPGYTRWPTATSFATQLAIGVAGASYTPLTGGTVGLYGFAGYLLHATADRSFHVFKQDGTGRNASTAPGGVRIPGREPVTFSEDDDGSLVLCGGGAPARWVPGDDTPLTLLCPTASAPVASHAAAMTRRLFVNDAHNDTVYYTSPTDHTVFDVSGNPNLIEAGWFRAESRRDPVLAMVSGWNLLYLVGEFSTDVYMPVDDVAGPVSLAWSSPMGTPARRSVIFSGDQVYLFGTDRRFWRLGEGRHFGQISFEIEDRLRALTTVDDCIGQELDIGGTVLLCWTFPTDQTTFVYDVAASEALGQATWYEWRGWNGRRWVAMPLAHHGYVKEWGEHFISGTESTLLYKLSMDTHHDAGQTRRCIRQTPPWDHATRANKYSAEVAFTTSRGTTMELDAGDPGYEPMLLVRHRNEGIRWGEPRELSLGRQGERAYTRRLPRNGMYRSREMEVEHTAAVEFFLGDVEEYFDVAME